MSNEPKPHPFKGRTASYKGELVTIIRGAHAGDADPGVELKGPHYLVQYDDGKKAIAPAIKVKVAPAEEQ